MNHVLAVVALGVLLGITPGAARAAAAQDQAILEELRQIRQLLEKLVSAAAQPAPTPGARGGGAPPDDKVTLPDPGIFALGDQNASVVVVEFTDLQCPYCRQFHTTAYEQLKKLHIDTGKVRFFTRDLPLESIHPFAMMAARASRCADEQGKFWEMRHIILINNAQLGAESFARFAGSLKLDTARFEACISDPSKYQSAIQQDLLAAASAGITATPSFVVGRITEKGVEGYRIVGAQPFAAFEAKIKELTDTVAAAPVR